MKNNKGFFLAETIIVLALVTTAIAFVLPNVTKVYENYKNTSKYYDQVKDIYILKAISETDEFKATAKTKTGSWCDVIDKLTNGNITNDVFASSSEKKALLKFEKLYILSYMKTPNDASGYEFQKYLNRMKKTSYDTTSYRLIGVFKEGSEERYASIKITGEGCTP